MSTARTWCAILPLIAVMATACGTTYPASIVIGRYQSPPRELWERSVRALREAGYEPVAADPARGQLAVASRSRPSPYGGARFELQLYRQGWVQVRLAGSVVHQGDRVSVPNDLAQEYEAFVFELMRILGDDDHGAERPSEAS